MDVLTCPACADAWAERTEKVEATRSAADSGDFGTCSVFATFVQ